MLKLVSCQVNIVKVLNFDNVHTQFITFRLIRQKIIDTTLVHDRNSIYQYKCTLQQLQFYILYFLLL
jgi:hypothetical protein